MAIRRWLTGARERDRKRTLGAGGRAARRPSVRVLLFASALGLLVSAPVTGTLLHLRSRATEASAVTYYTPPSNAAEWEGAWEFSELGADPSEANAESVRIHFTGTDLALRVRRGNFRGYFYITIDGEPANRLPRDERGAYLVLTSPDLEPQVVTIPVATRLADGLHVAEVVADRGWDQWPLAGWRVERAPEAAPSQVSSPWLA